MNSIFQRLGRYPASVAVDPRENRLTEALAVVLEHVEGLPEALVADWFDLEAAHTPARIRTQRVTTGGRFVDLELTFGMVASPALRVWVEIKHGADLHADQLANYVVDASTEIHSDWRLVLLAPRQSFPGDADEATPIEWQRVARTLGQYAKRVHLPDEQRWLLIQFLTYLKEQGLMDEHALNPGHAYALSALPGTERTIARLIEVAHPTIDAAWGSPNNLAKKGQKANYGIGWYATYPAPAGTTWGPAWFEWNFRTDEFRPETRDAVAFFAGITFESAKAAPLTADEWLGRAMQRGFERVHPWYWALWRPLYPERLLSEDDLERQASHLAAWVIESFKLLADHPPPVTP